MASGSFRNKGTLMVTTAKTQLGGDIIIPSVTKEIVNATPWGVPTTRTADIPYIVQVQYESDDTDLAPTMIPILVAPPEDASVTAASSSMIYKTYDLHCPVNAGDVIKVYGTNLVDGTTDPYVGNTCQISDTPTGKQQIFYANADALNNYGTGNDSYVAGGTIRINNVSRIVRATGLSCTNTTRTVTDSIGGTFKWESPDFRTKQPQQYLVQPTFENDLAAGNNQTPTTLVWDVNIPCEPTCAVTEYLDQEALTAAGGIAWITTIGYNKRSRRR